MNLNLNRACCVSFRVKKKRQFIIYIDIYNNFFFTGALLREFGIQTGQVYHPPRQRRAPQLGLSAYLLCASARPVAAGAEGAAIPSIHTAHEAISVLRAQRT